jgi:hypothetical protein
MRYVTDLMVLEGKGSEPPSGWVKIEKDLNAGAGGSYLYFAYEKGDNPARALTAITFLVGQDQRTPYGYTKINVDLNKGAHGKYIFTAFTRESRLSPGSAMVRPPIIDLDVTISSSPDVKYERPWVGITQDLNEGAKGKYVHLLYKQLLTESSSGEKLPFQVPI